MRAVSLVVRLERASQLLRVGTDWLRPTRCLFTSRYLHFDDPHKTPQSAQNSRNRNNKRSGRSGMKQARNKSESEPADSENTNIGEEIGGKLSRIDLNRILNDFYREVQIHQKALENGLDESKFFIAFNDFRKWCNESKVLPDELHVILSDISRKREPDDLLKIYPYFVDHALRLYPHLKMREDLLKISDLRSPANWYLEARAIKRKVIYHAGPTNSGKTYSALQSFLKAKSGVYCGPLKLLANEIYHRSNAAGTPCDLITGEERRSATEFNKPVASATNVEDQASGQVQPEQKKADAGHVACTVEMTSVSRRVEVAVVDEIQMIRDYQRGWAWTRVLLGVPADELHVCGEETAVDLVRSLVTEVGDEFVVNRYQRLTGLTFLNQAVGSFDRVRDGDCIVCFSRNDIFAVSRELERRGRQVSIIYGSLPPATKLAQAAKFNDPSNPCKLLVATDAIGMGLNLSIRRIVFYSLTKPVLVPREDGAEGVYEKIMTSISTSQALQIAGRAGRFGTQYSDGQVTTFRHEEVAELKRIVSREIEPITQAGLHPTAEQIELFAYHLPDASLSRLIEYFTELCQLDSSRFFLCDVETLKAIADMLEHVPLGLRERYVFCTAPIDTRDEFMCATLVKYAVRLSRQEQLTVEWLKTALNGWPLMPPNSVRGLLHLESSFDALELYLWLGLRFPASFPDMDAVRQMRTELEALIQGCVSLLTSIDRSKHTPVPSSTQESTGSDQLFDDDREVAFARPRKVQKASLLQQTLAESARKRASTTEGNQKSRSKRSRRKQSSIGQRERARSTSDELDSRDGQAATESDGTGQALSTRRLGGPGKIAHRLIKMGVLKPDELAKLQEELSLISKSDDKEGSAKKER